MLQRSVLYSVVVSVVSVIFVADDIRVVSVIFVADDIRVVSVILYGQCDVRVVREIHTHCHVGPRVNDCHVKQNEARIERVCRINKQRELIVLDRRESSDINSLRLVLVIGLFCIII